MLNAERFKKEILEKSNVVFDFSISKDRHTIEKCLGVCDNCIFCNIGEHCSNGKVKWLLSEYKEPVKLTKFECDILEYAFKNGYCYITRTESGHVEVHKEKPLMRSNEIFGHHWGNRGKSIYLFDNIFCFVKWVGSEKSKPMLIKEILDECEVIKNEND